MKTHHFDRFFSIKKVSKAFFKNVRMTHAMCHKACEIRLAFLGIMPIQANR